jgi:hypothetical protein
MLGICASLTLGCAEDSPAREQEADDREAVLQLSESPAAVIGGDDDREEYQLFRVTNAYRLANGEIVIANGGTHELRYYSELGVHVRSIGRQGEGPGEFRLIHSVSRIRGDTLVVWDPPLRRLSFLAPGGRLSETVQLGRSPASLTIGGQSVPTFPRSLHLLDDGTAIVEPGFPTQVMTRGPGGVRRDTIPLLVFDRNGGHIGMLGPVAAGETLVHEQTSMPMPFGHRLHVATGADGVYLGTGRSLTIERWTPAGEVADSILVPIELRPVRDDDFEAVKERILAWTDPRARGAMEAVLTAMPVPETMPAYSELRVAADGRLWIRENRNAPDDPQEWRILNPDGEPAARVTIPSGLELLDAGGDFVIVLARDELHVEEVRLYELSVAN